MARKFLVPIDLDKNALNNATLHPSGTAPTSPVKGQVWYDSTNNVLKVYNGTSWDTLSTGSGTITAVNGTTNEVETSTASGTVTVGLPNDVTITNNLTVGGNLTVSGTTTTINSETLTINDNVVVLNNNVTSGTPTENAGIEVRRGASTNASLLWDETADLWKAGLAGSETTISLAGHGHTSTDVSDFTEAAQDAAASMITGATHSGISVSYNDVGNTLAITNAGVTSVNSLTGAITAANLLSALLTVDGASSGLDADLLDGLNSSAFVQKYSANVGDGTSTSIAVTHSLGTRDVTVQVYDASTFATVECDQVRTSTSVVTLTFATAPASNAYRVVVHA